MHRKCCDDTAKDLLPIINESRQELLREIIGQLNHEYVRIMEDSNIGEEFGNIEHAKNLKQGAVGVKFALNILNNKLKEDGK